MENSALGQENAILKEQLENEISSTNNYDKQCNNVGNDNLMLLQQKGLYTNIYIEN